MTKFELVYFQELSFLEKFQADDLASWFTKIPKEDNVNTPVGYANAVDENGNKTYFYPLEKVRRKTR